MYGYFEGRLDIGEIVAGATTTGGNLSPCTKGEITMQWKVPFNLQLIVTEECNLRCSYCFEIDKGPRKMPVELAKKILDRELSSESRFTEYQVDLAGGEPFTCFEDLMEIVEYGISNSSRWGKKIHFFICSNLTLLNDTIKKWLEEKRDWIILGTSMDGTKEAHDRYRCGSYDDVVRHIPFYRRLYPSQGVKMTIGPDTIRSMYDGILNIESKGLTVSANVVYEPVWGNSETKKEYLLQFIEQLELLVQHYADNPSLEVPNLLSLPIRLLIKEQDPGHSWCGSGKTMRAYDTDGRVLPCHRFSRFCTKKIYKGPKSIAPRIPTKCDGCALSDACPACPGYNWQVYGNPESRTCFHCEFIKLQFLATAKLAFLRNESLLSKLADGPCKNIQQVSLDNLEVLQAVDFVMRNLDADNILAGF